MGRSRIGGGFRRDMARQHGDRLTTFEPLSGLIITCERYAEGWSVWIRHKHHAGLYSDCEAESYEKLSTYELGDVLQAVVLELGGWPGPGDFSDD